MTNSRHIARVLDQWCKNFTDGPMHKHLVLVGDIAGAAATYPPKLVRGVLVGLRDQMKEDSSMSAIEAQASGPHPTQPLFDANDKWVSETDEEFWDNISGESLPADLVKKARSVEIGWVNNIKLYNKVPRAQAASRGIKPITVRWVDVSKGDKRKYNIRSRLVGRELKAKTRESLLAHELFSAMPPWEAIKTLLSLLVTDDIET